MVQTAAANAKTAQHDYIVLRPICLQGERVEVDEIVQLNDAVGSELASANKVRRYDAKAQAKAEADALKAAKTAQAEAEALAAADAARAKAEQAEAAKAAKKAD